LEDRFGPIPQEAEDLIDTIRLRWLAEFLGMEKIVLKSGKLIAAFVSDEASPYFQGPVFARVLDYLKLNPKSTKMYQRNGGLRMSIEAVDSPNTALHHLESMAGVKAEQAAPDFNSK
jgi:transcription-repair coupling factor (superfamily II helicase)